MPLRYLMDEQVPKAITVGLRAQGIDVITALEDGSDGLEDAPLLQRAAALGRVLFTRDKDFLKIGASLQRQGGFFAGIVYAHQVHVGIGVCVEDLVLMGSLMEAEEMHNAVKHLPL